MSEIDSAVQEPTRCGWVSSHPLYQQYHDTQWGRPVLNDQELFAKLCLDGQQAGLSWFTILQKQKNYEKAFFNFDPHKIIRLTEKDVEALLQNPGIVRNRLKVNSIIRNAKAYLAIKEKQTFCDFIWQFTNHKSIVNQWQRLDQLPVTTLESDAMSKALKKAGFNFVGSTICYAFMQAVGMVNDHTVDCHCYDEVVKLARR
ncbi:DNA-3-methyladenine glycosylase I [Alteromonas sp. ASW11-36]|uniref:DNA-3-methyladenine glycosylase I n=1 Tax=Alteromonas arenosi TaxID=3055817 RepID=A0ABT7SUW8_9ALTE|nr:DNA-3-methyladenine glycosylase I [Alteromonas sp. ASW11-36]MDM7859352.1 DNA-3-methyladenine glycosylase I [Alteromonas sp. ASW11-36]